MIPRRKGKARPPGNAPARAVRPTGSRPTTPPPPEPRCPGRAAAISSCRVGRGTGAATPRRGSPAATERLSDSTPAAIGIATVPSRAVRVLARKPPASAPEAQQQAVGQLDALERRRLRRPRPTPRTRRPWPRGAKSPSEPTWATRTSGSVPAATLAAAPPSGGGCGPGDHDAVERERRGGADDGAEVVARPQASRGRSGTTGTRRRQQRCGVGERGRREAGGGAVVGDAVGDLVELAAAARGRSGPRRARAASRSCRTRRPRTTLGAPTRPRRGRARARARRAPRGSRRPTQRLAQAVTTASATIPSPPPDEAQPLARRGLDVDLVLPNAEELGEARAHRPAMRRDPRRLGEDRQVAAGRRASPRSPARVSACRTKSSDGASRQRSSLGGKCSPMSPAPQAPRIASVTACSGDVGVRVAGEPGLAGDLDAAQPQRPPRRERVDVDALPDPGPARRRRPPAASRSSGCVTFTLRGSPGTAATGPPWRSTSAASSVQCASPAAAHARAQHAGAERLRASAPAPACRAAPSPRPCRPPAAA